MGILLNYEDFIIFFVLREFYGLLLSVDLLGFEIFCGKKIWSDWNSFDRIYILKTLSRFYAPNNDNFGFSLFYSNILLKKRPFKDFYRPRTLSERRYFHCILLNEDLLKKNILKNPWLLPFKIPEKILKKSTNIGLLIHVKYYYNPRENIPKKYTITAKLVLEKLYLKNPRHVGPWKNIP